MGVNTRVVRTSQIEMPAGGDIIIGDVSLVDEVKALSGLDATELGYLDGVTAGTVTASKAVVVDANKDVGDMRNVDVVNLDAGASGTAGSVDIFPTTASKGKFTLACNDQTGDTTVSLKPAAMGQATVVTIPDPGAATSYVAQSTAALTLAEVDVLDGVTAGTQAANKAVVADANVNTGVSKVTQLHIGATGAEVQVNATPAQLNELLYYPGQAAAAFIDFSAAGEAAMTITIDGVVYAEADVADAPNGVWTNGATAADSATSLIAAINGDTRAAVPFTAVTDVSGDGVWLFWDAVGTAGNVTISTTSAANCTVQNSTGGAAAGLKQVFSAVHTVNTQELLSGAVEIPVPFAPTKVMVHAYSSTGLSIAFTDLVTIQTAPNRIRIATNGATNLANTNVVHLTAVE